MKYCPENTIPTHILCKHLGLQISVDDIKKSGVNPAFETVTGSYWDIRDVDRIIAGIAENLLRKIGEEVTVDLNGPRRYSAF